MSSADGPAVERIIAQTINETAPGYPDATWLPPSGAASNAPGVTENETDRVVHRGTKGSNPLSSSRQSVSHRISPPPQERRGFSAILAVVRGGGVRQRRAKPGTIAPTRGNVSVGRYSSTTVPPDAICEIGGTRRK